MADAEVRVRFGALSAAEVRALDSAAEAAGVDVALLMEVAGFQVARTVWEQLGDAPGVVAVLAGHGNNGGDGLVAARHLRTWGCSVRAHVVAAAEGALRGAAAGALAAARGAGVVVTVGTTAAEARAALEGSAVAVDALLGTGADAPPREPEATAIRALLDHPAVVAVDVPSGLNATTGEPYDPCVTAVVTCTLAACKLGLLAADDAHAGAIVVADICMPATAWAAAGLTPPRLIRGGVILPLRAAPGC